MRSSEFIQWLQGYFDLADINKGLTQEQVDIIKAHLNMVFFHEIDKSYPASKLLTEIHEKGKRGNKRDIPLLNGNVNKYIDEIKKSTHLIPKELILKYKILPLSEDIGKTDRHIEIIIPDSEVNNLEMMDNLRFRIGCEIEFYVAPKKQIENFIIHMFLDDREALQTEESFPQDGGYDGEKIIRC